MEFLKVVCGAAVLLAGGSSLIADCPDEVADLGGMNQEPNLRHPEFRKAEALAANYLRGKKDSETLSVHFIASELMGMSEAAFREGEIDVSKAEFGQTPHSYVLEIIRAKLRLKEIEIRALGYIDLKEDEQWMNAPVFRVSGMKRDILKLLSFKAKEAKIGVRLWMGLTDPRVVVPDQSPLLRRTRWILEENRTYDWIQEDKTKSLRDIFILAEQSWNRGRLEMAVDRIREAIKRLRLEGKVDIHPQDFGTFAPPVRLAGAPVLRAYRVTGLSRDLEVLLKAEAKRLEIGATQFERAIEWFGVSLQDPPAPKQ